MPTNSRDPALYFFLTMVEPTVEQFMRKIHDARLGCLSCLVLASMADHYFHAREKPIDGQTAVGRYRHAVGNQNWAFKQIVAVSNATKHVLATDDRIGFEHLSTQEITVGNMRCGWPINGRVTMVETEPGKLWLLRDLVGASTDMWREKLGLPIKSEET